MPEPIATAAVAIIEFTMVRHWFLSLTAILAFTIWCFIVDAAPDLNKDGVLFEHSHPFVSVVLFPLILVYGCFCVVIDALGIKTKVGTRNDAARLLAAICRIYAKNVRLFFRLVLGVLLLITVVGAAISILSPKERPLANGGGPESERFFGFMNTVTAPLQWIVDGIRMLLGILAIIFLVTLYYAGKVLAFSPMVTLAIMVLVYLVWLWSTARQIVAEEYGKKAPLAHAFMALIPAQLGTWVIFVIFLGATQSAFAWIWSQIPA